MFSRSDEGQKELQELARQKAEDILKEATKLYEEKKLQEAHK